MTLGGRVAVEMPTMGLKGHLLTEEPFNVIEPTPEMRTYTIKLGWIQGVLIPCLLNIWGVMLFLRIAWIVAQAGIGYTLLIIGISSAVCVITTLSLSAICTNGVVQGGGIYYLVSRSLGAELGASVGVLFAFANAVAASMNTIGFCDSLNDLLRRYDAKIVDNSLNDVRIIGAIALLVMCLICAVGMDWETKTQNFLITVILLALLNYVLGVSLGPLSSEQKAKGFVGINVNTAAANWKPDYRELDGKSNNFFSIFAMYFPAVTGVQAGANICGDLKNPASAIPKGTLLALLISTISYIGMAALSGVAALRDASGIIKDIPKDGHDFQSLETCKPKCNYGLHNSYEVMQIMAYWDLLIFFGCWAATLSTALTNLLAVPRLIQALGKDRIYPGLIFFSKPFGRHGEPYRGYVLTFLVSFTFLLIADLDTVAPLITNFYLASYAMINFCTFHADLVHHLSWRPQFQYYNKWISFMGFCLCLTIMIIISWIMALTTVLIFLTLYLMVLYRKPSANWGSSTDAQKYFETVNHILYMSGRKQPIKSYNPQILVLAGRPHLRPSLIEVGNLITKQGSFMFIAHIEREELENEDRIALLNSGQKWLNAFKYRGFFVVIDGLEFELAVKALLQSAGLGRLATNILLVGYKERWHSRPKDRLISYIRCLQCCIDHQVSLAIFRSTAIGRLVHKTTSLNDKLTDDEQITRNHIRGLFHANSEVFLKTKDEIEVLQTKDKHYERNKELHLSASAHSSKGAQTNSNARWKKPVSLNENDKYQHSLLPSLDMSEDSTIDAWWLFDDGGLNILLPYIISTRGGFKGKLPLRIFALNTKFPGDGEVATAKMQELLSKFRIQYDELLMIHGLDEEPSESTWTLFDSFIKDFRTQDDESSDMLITNKEFVTLLPKTRRYLKLREKVLEYSLNSSLIILTLPLPRKGQVSAALYMAWLEILSQQMPPILFIRGNSATVLAE